MGMFDDLIPGAQRQEQPSYGMFADLVPEQRSDLGRGFETSIRQLGPLARGAVGLVGATVEEAAGRDNFVGQLAGGVKNWGLRGYEEGMAKLAPLQRETDDITIAWNRAKDGDLGALADWAQYGLGYALGQAGEAAGMAVLGGVAGAAMAPAASPVTAPSGAVTGLVAKGAVKEFITGLIEKSVVREAGSLAAAAAKEGAQLTAEQAVKIATRNVAREIGASGALLGLGTTQELGSIYPEAEQQAADEGRALTGSDLARVWGSGLVAGGVEALTDRLGVQAAMGKVKFPGASTRAGAAAGTALAGMGVEGATEAVQTGIERFGAGRDVFSEEGQREMVGAAALGALGGGAVGGVVGLVQGPARQRADAALGRLNSAGSVDEAIAAFNDTYEPLEVPKDFDADGAMKRLERQMQKDVEGLRDFSGRTPDVVRRKIKSADSADLSAPGAWFPGTPADGVAIEVEEAPFGDRLLDLREQLQDSRLRQRIRDELGPEALNDVLYYAQQADNVSLPGKTSDRMLELAEAIVQRATLKPIRSTLTVEGTQPLPQVGAAPAPLAIGLDTAPTGTIRVDQQGVAVPETRADVVSLRDRARAMAERRAELGQQTPRGMTPEEARMAVPVGEGRFVPIPPAPAPQLPAPAGQPGKRGAFEAAEAERALSLRERANQMEAIVAVNRAGRMEGGTAMAEALRRAGLSAAPVDVAAHETAATSPTNSIPEPTQAQKDAGNYQVGRVKIGGLNISIENPEGSTRKGVDRDGKPWENRIKDAHYGYVRLSEAKDGDHVDVFIKPGTMPDYAGPAFVIDQIDPSTGRYDEAKVVLGAKNEGEARAIYAANYAPGWKGLGAITRMEMPRFKDWVLDHEATKKPVALKARAAEMKGKTSDDLQSLRQQWRDAVARGDGDAARAINERIVSLKRDTQGGQAGGGAAAEASPSALVAAASQPTSVSYPQDTQAPAPSLKQRAARMRKGVQDAQAVRGDTQAAGEGKPGQRDEAEASAQAGAEQRGGDLQQRAPGSADQRQPVRPSDGEEKTLKERAGAMQSADARIAAAEKAGVKLSTDDKAKVRDALERASDLRKKADRTSAAGSDPMNKGDAFPMGVGFTKMTKRAEQRIDASVRRAGEAVALYKKAEMAQREADSLLQGKGTQEDQQRKAERRTEMQRAVVRKLLGWKKGDKVGGFTIERVNKDRDGYPATYTISGAGIVQGVQDKVDVVRELFGGDKKKFRAMVDFEKASTGPQDKQQAAGDLDDTRSGSGLSGNISNPDNEINRLSAEAVAMSRDGPSAVRWLAQHAADPTHRDMAKRLEQFIGDDVEVQFVKKGDSVPAGVARRLNDNAAAVAQLRPDGSYKIWARPDKAMNEALLLHELIHAATMRALRGTKNAALRADLQNLLAAMRRTFTDVEHTGAIDMQQREQAAFFTRVLTDEDELLAYAFSSPTMRRWLKNMNDKGQFKRMSEEQLREQAERGEPWIAEDLSLWQRFVDWVRKAIGLPEKYAPELARLLDEREGRVQAFVERNKDSDLYERLDQYLQQAMEAQAREKGSVEPAMASGVDTSTSDVAKMQAIVDAAEYESYGIRIVSDDDPINVGGTTEPSEVYLDGEPTGEYLDGTSAVRVFGSVNKALQRANQEGYRGTRVLLLGANDSHAGEDAGETVMRDAVVLGEWQKTNFDNLRDAVNGSSDMRAGTESIFAGLRGFDQTAARNLWLDATTSHGSNAWFNGVRTQYAKAKNNPTTFGRVFDAVQDYIKNISTFANAAADLAPGILPKLETLRDLTRKDTPAADLKAAGAALWKGTLTDKKVYGRAELDAMGLTKAQQDLYFEARAAIDQSLDDLTKTEIVRLAGNNGLPAEQATLAAPNATEAAAVMGDYLRSVGDTKGAETVQEKATQAERLKAEGYAPLMRFGRHTLHITRGGETLFFGMYESRMEANRARRELADDSEFKGADFKQGLMSQEAYRLYGGMPLDALELFAKNTGNEDNAIYQNYLRLTKNNRSALKRLIKRQGIAGFSEDTSRVLASFVTSNARMASGNLHLGRAKQFADAIPKEMGDLKDDAINLVTYVQDPQEEAPALRGLLFTHFIGGSVASAAVNLTQPFTMTLPYLSQFGGLSKATGHLMAAARTVAARSATGDLAAALERAEADGIVSPQEIHHLQAEAMGTLNKHPLLRKAAFVWGSLFSLSEQFNRRVTFIAAWNTARENGIADPFKFAEEAVIETQSLHNRGNKPNWARGPIGATVFTFRQFSIHYLEFLTRMWQSGPAGKRAVGTALAILLLVAGAGGLPFADDLDDLIDTLAQALGYDFSSKRAKREFIAKTLGLGETAADVATRGLSALPGMPIDVSLRMGLGNLLPGTGLLLRSNTDKSRDLLEFAGAAGSLGRSAIDAGSKALRGDLVDAGMAMAPVAIQNMAKAVTMWNTGEYRNTRGEKVMNVDAVDAAMKFIGFQPAEVARESAAMGEVQRSVQLAKNVEGEIVAKWAQGVVDKDRDAVQDARGMLEEWNRKNPRTPIRISRSQINQRVRNMTMTRAERFARSTPRELRPLVQENFEPQLK